MDFNTFNTEPYFDDYNPTKDFYRILFRPSYAVQARELTQLQTILQNQVTRFGDHVFKNGSQVIPGSVNVDNKVHFIKLKQFTNNVDVTTYIKEFKNKIITGETSGVKLRVLDTSSTDVVTENLDTPTLYCKIEGTSAEDFETNRLIPGESVVARAIDNQIATNFLLKEDQLGDIRAFIRTNGSVEETATSYSGNSSSDVLGYAYSVEVKAGIYYIDGMFVRNDDLKLYVGRFTNVPSCRVGFKVTEQTITPELDKSILDNAAGSSNFAAPGAHRHKVSLTLVKLDLVATDNIKFVELVRIVEGRVQKKVETSSYAELEKTLARRTFDESGNYEVNKFKLSAREHNNNGTNFGVYTEYVAGDEVIEGFTYGDKNKFCVVVDPGKAYIQGYEVESTASQYIDFKKARVIDGVENNHVKRIPRQSVGLNVGNYVNVTNAYKAPAINQFEKVYLLKTFQPKLATLTATISAGVVTGVNIIDGGSGYTQNVALVFSPISAGGTGAAATGVVTNGKITSITGLTGGSGYAYAPVVQALQQIPTGVAASSSDIVGTARVKSYQLDSGSYTGVTTVYKLGLFDINMLNGASFDRDVKSVVGVNATGNFAADISITESVLVGSATATQNSATITGSGTNFMSTVKAGDVIYINGSRIGTVASAPTSNLQLTLTTAYLGSTISNGRVAIFTAFLEESQYDTLLFPVGQANIMTLRGVDGVEDTVKDSTIITRRQFNMVNTTGNKPEFEISDQYETFLSDMDLTNYTLIDYTTNVPVNITESQISFDTTNVNSRRKVYFSDVPNSNYYLIASVQNVTSSAAERPKALNVNVTQTITGKKDVSIPSIDLNHGDILRLKSVKMNPGTFDAYVEGTAVDITERYTLDNGQRPTYYTYGKVLLKPGYQYPSGAIKITYDYFSTTGSEGNYFSVDSYMYSGEIEYEEIPTYFVTDPTTGKKVEKQLSDVLDFRPVLTETNGFYPELPKIGSDMSSPVAYYLGRIDKLVLDSFGRFNVIEGIPSASPKEPEDPKEGLVLGTVAIQPYTRDINSVLIKQRENRRYTMSDIGKLERRISNLEYYVTLSLLEKDTATMQIRDEVTNLDRFKNGFIVDQFTGHGIGDVKNEDYRVAIDPTTRVLRAMHSTVDLEIVEALVSGTDRLYKPYQKTGDLITLSYTENPFIFNNNATRSMDIHAISMGAFKGQISLYPESDNWKSVTRKPDLVVVDDNNYDAIKFMAEELGVTGTKWNEWQTNWTSTTTRDSDVYETRTFDSTRGAWGNWLEVTGYVDTFTDQVGYNWRDGLNTSLSSTVNSQDYGDRIIDMSYIPYMRSRPVTVIAQNLKGATRFYPFFDGTSVSDYVTPADVFRVTRVSNSVMSFDLNDLNNNVLADNPRRAYNGKFEQAFSIGDVLTNNTHTATNIKTITNLTYEGTEFSLTVSDANSILPGHHVVLYNLDYHSANTQKNINELQENQNIPASTGISSTTSTSKELNLRRFKVLSVTPATETEDAIIRLGAIDGSTISAFSAYSTSSYTSGNFGKLYRLKASCVALYGGEIISSDSIGPIQQTVYMGNIKNGFAVGESLTGSVNIRDLSSVNGVTITSINGSNITSAPATMKKAGDKIITDDNGTAICVFDIPENKNLSFRTGERTFKLTDNPTDGNSSFDSIGSAVYYSQGISLVTERTIVSSRTAQFVQAETYEDTQSLPAVRRSTTSTRQIYQYAYDPLAQTFTINSPGGVFVTSIDLYFAVSGDRPVTIEIRNTDNGVPSSKVVPFTQVTKPASELIASDDSSKKTTFKFKSPVYLQDTETYAVVVMTDKPGTQLYVSEMGNNDMLTGNTIAGQPLTGSLYASQNAKEWEIHTLLDMKFSLNKASFDTSTPCEVFFKANPPEQYLLPNNPFEITPGTSLVRVYAPNHGLLVDEKVTISGVPEGCYGTTSGSVGIPSTILNGTHVINSAGLDKDSFIINLTLADNQGNTFLKGITTTASFVKGEYGGNTIRCTRALPMDIMYFKTSDVVLKDTKISYYVRAQKETKAYEDYTPFVPNSNYTFGSRMHINSYDNQYVESTDPLIKRSSLLIKAVIESTNSNISPVIDIQKLSAYAISNSIDNKTSAIINVPEIDTRKILAAGDVNSSAVTSSGTGTITASTSSATVTGTNTLFKTQVAVGNLIKSGGYTLGVVSSITDDTHLTLTANAYSVASSAAFTIVSAPTYTVTPTGTITTSTSSATVTGQSTTFTTSLVVGSILTQTNGTVIGVVASIQSNTSLTLETNAKVAQTTTAFKANIAYNLQFTNENNRGVISSNIDAEDNLLASCGIGKTLIIEGVADGINGTYVVNNVQDFDDVTTFAGNSDKQVTKVTLDRAFSTTANIDALTDSDFSIKVYDKYVSDIAPFGCHNAANYITRTLSLTESADVLKIMFDANIPNNTTVKVYYRTWSGEVDLRKVPYTDTGFTASSSDMEGTYLERDIELKGLSAFNNVCIKIVMKSTNPVFVPKIKNLRVLALS